MNHPQQAPGPRLLGAGTIGAKRIPRHRWIPARWEATRRLGHNSYEVAYGFTRRAAIRNLKRHQGAVR